ncbi:hypothetical protein [Paenibacillus sp. NAIST15-1]|nr:hypothetical protein [Paenibacillus sp. NAIST15-1]GAV14804.1 hypothetical protein PBN151_4783 [Paenibacillus sp. NAIST15-1]
MVEDIVVFLGEIVLMAGPCDPLVFKTPRSSSGSASVVAVNSLRLRREQD